MHVGKRSRLIGVAGIVVLAAAAVAMMLVFTLGGESELHMGKFAGGDPDQPQASSGQDTPGEGVIGGYDAYIAAAQAYPPASLAWSTSSRERSSAAR